MIIVQKDKVIIFNGDDVTKTDTMVEIQPINKGFNRGGAFPGMTGGQHISNELCMVPDEIFESNKLFSQQSNYDMKG